MTDLLFDFTVNDLALVGGDFARIDTCSMQNATLIFNKSAASLVAPQVGVGFEEIFANISQRSFGALQALGERLIRSDGAKMARVTIMNNGRVAIQAKYEE